MLRLLDAPDPARHIEDLAAYVYRALRNRVIDVLRGRRSERSLDAPALEGEKILCSIRSRTRE